jgi:beta-glucanase (GH16 family)
MHFIITSHFIILATLHSVVSAVCECGYRTDTGDIWQYALLTDFNSFTDASFRNSPDWAISTDSHPATANIQYTTSNVKIVNSKLQLTCSAYNSATMTCNAGQILSKRNDVLYGSFRATFSITGGAGAVGALFVYGNDDNEVDIEVVTRDPPQYVQYTNQQGPNKNHTLPNGALRTSSLHYRFDSTNTASRFYVNGVLGETITDHIPKIGGSIYMNMWANGGSWPGPPPTSDVILTVDSLYAYFNTSNAVNATNWASQCKSKAAGICSTV